MLLLCGSTLVADENNIKNVPKHKIKNGKSSVEAMIGKQPALVYHVICGPSCIYLIMNLKGKTVNLSDILDATPNFSLKDGCSLQDLEHCAQKIGLNMHSSHINLYALESYTCPFILHTKSSHFIVISNVSDNKVTMCNPSKNTPAVITSEEIRQFANPYGLVWETDIANSSQRIIEIVKEFSLILCISIFVVISFLYLCKFYARCSCKAVSRTIPK